MDDAKLPGVVSISDAILISNAFSSGVCLKLMFSVFLLTLMITKYDKAISQRIGLLEYYVDKSIHHGFHVVLHSRKGRLLGFKSTFYLLRYMNRGKDEVGFISSHHYGCRRGICDGYH